MSYKAGEKFREWWREWRAIERGPEEQAAIARNPMSVAADAFLAGRASRDGDLVVFKSQLDHSKKVIDQLWRDVELARGSEAKAAEYNRQYTAENVRLRRELEQLLPKDSKDGQTE